MSTTINGTFLCHSDWPVGRVIIGLGHYEQALGVIRTFLMETEEYDAGDLEQRMEDGELEDWTLTPVWAEIARPLD